jgi:hypothetical protein
MAWLAWSLWVLLAASIGCAVSEEPLPTPRATARAETCADPVPPPLIVLESPTDPSECLAPSKRFRRLTVALNVAAAGRVKGVGEFVELCSEVGPNGLALPPLELTPAEEQCVLQRVASWRFAAFNTCAAQQALVVIGGSASPSAANLGKPGSPADRAFLGGGPTSGCS